MSLPGEWCRLLLLGALGLPGCGRAVASNEVDAGAEETRGALLLDRHPEKLLDLTLPDRSRAAPPELIPVNGAWRAVATVGGVRTWETELPVRLRTLFFSTPPDDLEVFDAEQDDLRHLRTSRLADTAGSWEFGPTSLRVRRPAEQGPPLPGEYTVRYRRATEREEELNLETSGMSQRDFVFRSLQLGDATRHGLLLPAPAAATFLVTVPEDGIFTTRAGLLPPEAADLPASDGATLVVSVSSGQGDFEVVHTDELEVGRFGRSRVPLTRFAGQTVRLRFSTEPGAEATGDYVFLAEPTVRGAEEDPPRVVLVFIDTLRADHLPMYGYPRETTPNLARWTEGAALFEQARSIAPWTLPSTRTMVTGVVPERWTDVESLPSRFARAGWATAFIAGNIYLSSNFEIDRDWGLHRCINWPRAEVEVDRALAFLDEHEDQPVFMVVHLMDQHLPYREPLRWRFRFAGLTPEILGGDRFLRAEIQQVDHKLGEEGKQYLRDRYDNNLAYVDHELKRLFGRLDVGERDTVLVLADHGEEFWDHGGFEHGHTLYDELLRIPLLLAGPGIPKGRFSEPVSMLDVAPTLAAAAGLSLEGMSGWPLQGVADRSRAAEFQARPQAFGRPLYGEKAWGSLLEGRKYVSSEGREKIFLLESDPAEDHARVPSDEDREALSRAMADALDMPVVLAWRLIPSERSTVSPTEAELTVPGGVAAAWVADDPTAVSVATAEVEGETVRMRWEAGNVRALEVFVVPNGDPVASLADARLVLHRAGDELVEASRTWSDDERPPRPDGLGGTLLRARAGPRALTMDYAVLPLPYDSAVGGYDAEVRGELQALGYLDHAEDEAEDER